MSNEDIILLKREYESLSKTIYETAVERNRLQKLERKQHEDLQETTYKLLNIDNRGRALTGRQEQLETLLKGDAK